MDRLALASVASGFCEDTFSRANNEETENGGWTAFIATKRRFFYSMDGIKNKSLMNTRRIRIFAKGVYTKA